MVAKMRFAILAAVDFVAAEVDVVCQTHGFASIQLRAAVALFALDGVISLRGRRCGSEKPMNYYVACRYVVVFVEYEMK